MNLPLHLKIFVAGFYNNVESTALWIMIWIVFNFGKPEIWNLIFNPVGLAKPGITHRSAGSVQGLCQGFRARSSRGYKTESQRAKRDGSSL
jgi:hypothetical protein